MKACSHTGMYSGPMTGQKRWKAVVESFNFDGATGSHPFSLCTFVGQVISLSSVWYDAELAWCRGTGGKDCERQGKRQGGLDAESPAFECCKPELPDAVHDPRPGGQAIQLQWLRVAFERVYAVHSLEG